MNLNKDSWGKQDYNQFFKYLTNLSDKKLSEFNKSLLNDDIKVIGVKTPILKDIAKEISKGNYLEFIERNSHECYEEIIIHGLIIGYLKQDFQNILYLLDDFLKYNTNWAINDITCANLKIFKKNMDEGYQYILNLLKDRSPFTKRFGIVLLLDFYINDIYIDKILDIILTINDDNYYVKMALSWFVSICYIKYPMKIVKILKKKKLNVWIHNKSIQKIIESKRVSTKDKEMLKQLKI